jgi:sporulation integral membrane protein YtvI
MSLFRNIVIIVIGLAFLYGLFTVGFPFLLAIVAAIFIEPLNHILMKVARLNRLAAATISCTLFTLSLLGAAYLLGLKIVSELITFWKRAPSYLDGMNSFILDFTQQTQIFYDSLSPEQAQQFQRGIETGVDALTNALNNLISGISGYFLDIAKTIPSLFIFYIVFTVALYLFSFSVPILKRSFLTLFHPDSQDKMESILLNLRRAIFGFMKAQFILSMLTYIVALIGLFILKVDYPLAIALLIVIVDILPILGTGSLILPWAIYCLVTGNTFLAVGLLILFLVITVFRRTVEPKILGDSVGIGALSALISLYIGFKLVGVIGLFLGPIVVIVYQAMRKVGLLNIKIKLE